MSIPETSPEIGQIVNIWLAKNEVKNSEEHAERHSPFAFEIVAYNPLDGAADVNITGSDGIPSLAASIAYGDPGLKPRGVEGRFCHEQR